jgi:hypothetical protein
MRNQAVSNIQEKVQEAIDEMVESGAERGLQVAVYHRGGRSCRPGDRPVGHLVHALLQLLDLQGRRIDTDPYARRARRVRGSGPVSGRRLDE